MPLVERRYAEALVGISEKEGKIEEYQQEFQSIVDIFNNQQDFRLFLLNPEIKTEVKKGFVEKIFKNSIRPEMTSFLMLLLDKGRIKLLPTILDEFTRLADKKKNTLSMTIISAVELDESQISKIKEKYREVYQARQVKADVEIDSSVIGGVKVKIGDKVIDGTVKGRLDSLRELLVK
ncbi:MAG: F0F1 ATP synthase subunit delta [Clostridia bacterium]|nr:F0F1 ATP synthase subunit delta [Clostridia bacterium]